MLIVKKLQANLVKDGQKTRYLALNSVAQYEALFGAGHLAR